jgi:hypothetical protein
VAAPARKSFQQLRGRSVLDVVADVRRQFGQKLGQFAAGRA